MPIAAGVAYVILAVIMILVRARRPIVSAVVDWITSCLCLLVLVLAAEFLFGLAHVPGSSTRGLTSAPTLSCLVLLTLIVIPSIYAVVKGIAIRSSRLAPSLQQT